MERRIFLKGLAGTLGLATIPFSVSDYTDVSKFDPPAFECTVGFTNLKEIMESNFLRASYTRRMGYAFAKMLDTPGDYFVEVQLLRMSRRIASRPKDVYPTIYNHSTWCCSAFVPKDPSYKHIPWFIYQDSDGDVLYRHKRWYDYQGKYEKIMSCEVKEAIKYFMERKIC